MNGRCALNRGRIHNTMSHESVLRALASRDKAREKPSPIGIISMYADKPLEDGTIFIIVPPIDGVVSNISIYVDKIVGESADLIIKGLSEVAVISVRLGVNRLDNVIKVINGGVVKVCSEDKGIKGIALSALMIGGTNASKG